MEKVRETKYCRGAKKIDETDIRKIPQIVWAESGSLTVPV
jgi:hypothetical protein